MDYLAIKRLANQLLQGDAERLEVHDLADLVLSQPQVGTTIKCDGKESDPYAILTVLNLQRHQVHVASSTSMNFVYALPPALEFLWSVCFLKGFFCGR